MDKEKVVLVDKKDFQLGLMPKLEAHRKGVLHRAFSIFIFNSSRMLLMQKRSSLKYHSPGLWTNTCCSHQRDGERTIDAAKRRLNEEMGLNVDLKELIVQTHYPSDFHLERVFYFSFVHGIFGSNFLLA